MSDEIRTVRTPHTKQRPYFSMNRKSAQDERLSWEARGVLAYLLSKPDDWQVMIVDLQQQCGRDKVRKILAELQKYHYLDVTQAHDDKGKFLRNEYVIHETPFTENPSTAEPSTDKPFTENHPLHSIELQSIEYTEDRKENNPLPLKRGKRVSIPRKSWERQKFLDYYTEHSEALAAVTEAWGYNTRFVDLTTLDMYELAATWYGLEEIFFQPENYVSLFSHTHAVLGWKKNLSPLDALGQVEEWKRKRLTKPAPQPIPEGHYDPALDDGTPATLEQIAAAKAQWAELLKSKNGNSEVRS